MQYTVEKISGNKIKISFTAPAATFEEAIQKAYIKYRSRFQVQGFRKGKAPRKLIERMYGDSIFYDDALELLFPDAYMEAIEKDDLHPVSRPEVNVETVEKGQDVKFSCEVFVFPEIKLGEYKGVDITRTLHAVTEEELNSRLQQEQKKVARAVDITDRPVENGDEINLDYSGSVDGVKFDGGTAEGQTLVIGSNSFIPGFEEQMIGTAVGEEKDITVTFPTEYHAEDLKGKDAVFHVKVNAITHEELPTLDDDFAADVSEFDTLKEYKDDLQKQMQETADEQATGQAKQALIQKIVEASEVDLPDPMVEEKLDDQLREMDYRMQQQGLNMQKYRELTGQTEEQMREMYRPEAKNNLKTEMVIGEIVKKEAIEASSEAVDEMLSEYTAAMGKTLEELKKELNEAQMGYFEDRVKTTAALDLLWNSAVVKDETAKEAEPENAADKNAEAKADEDTEKEDDK